MKVRQRILNSAHEQSFQHLHLHPADLAHCLRFHFDAGGDRTEAAKREPRLLDLGVVGDYLSVELWTKRMKLVWE